MSDIQSCGFSEERSEERLAAELELAEARAAAEAAVAESQAATAAMQAAGRRIEWAARRWQLAAKRGAKLKVGFGVGSLSRQNLTQRSPVGFRQDAC